MYQKERLEQIIKILKKVHYTTVDYLVEQIRYSPATIRRDLTQLEKKEILAWMPLPQPYKAESEGEE